MNPQLDGFSLPAMLFALPLLTAAIIDLYRLRIPNVIPVSLATLYLALALLHPVAGSPYLWHLAAGFLALLVGFGLFAWGKLGGGDAKLLAAVAMWYGFPLLLPLLVAIAFCGLFVVSGVLAARAAGLGLLLEARGIRISSLQSGTGVPYGVAIAAGGLLMLPSVPLLASFQAF